MEAEIERKVVPYIITGTSKKEQTEFGFQIRNTKQEETFRKFSESTSSQRMLCKLTSRDPLLRLFFFLKGDISYQPVEDYPLVLRYPIFLEYNESFLDAIDEEPTRKIIDEMSEKNEKTRKTVKELSSSLLWKFFTAAVSDKQVSTRLRRRKYHMKQDELDNLFDGLVKRRKKQFDDVKAHWIDAASSLYYATEYYLPLIEARKMIENAKENLSLLSISLGAKRIRKALRTSLSKLIGQRVLRVKVRSLCMECALKKEFEPYSLLEKYSIEPFLPSECGKCNGRTIFHQIELETPYSFAPLFKENRLPEFILGYTLATSKRIRRLYIHKNVATIGKEGPAAGHQMDIFAITEHDNLLVGEVTTSKDLNHIMKGVKKKETALKDFPYDALVVLTPSLEVEKYLDYDKTRIFGARHLPKIVSHIDYLIDEIDKRKKK